MSKDQPLLVLDLSKAWSPEARAAAAEARRGGGKPHPDGEPGRRVGESVAGWKRRVHGESTSVAKQHGFKSDYVNEDRQRFMTHPSGAGLGIGDEGTWTWSPDADDVSGAAGPVVHGDDKKDLDSFLAKKYGKGRPTTIGRTTR